MGAAWAQYAVVSARERGQAMHEAVQTTPLYRVIVLEHGGMLDETAEYCAGEYETCMDAVAACRRVINDFCGYLKCGMTAAKLFEGWLMYGESAIIETDDPACDFDGHDYAQRRFHVAVQDDARRLHHRQVPHGK